MFARFTTAQQSTVAFVAALFMSAALIVATAPVLPVA